MLGQPVSMLIPEVVGFRLSGELKEGITATDLVLTVTQMLRAEGRRRPLRRILRPGPRQPDRSPTARRSPTWRPNMARPAASSRSTSGRIDYLRADRPRRRPDRAGPRLCPGAGPVARRVDARAAVHRHARARHEHDRAVARRAQAAAGPGAAERRRRPVQRRARATPTRSTTTRASPVEGESFDFGNGDVVIAAITSCTNTSNPSVLVAAGLVARKARAKGLTSKPWVKTSLAPGSQVVTDYLNASGPQRGPRTRSASTSSAMAARPASAIRGRSPSRSARRSTTRIWSRSASCRATAISKAGCRPTAAPIISPRRRWWSPMR